MTHSGQHNAGWSTSTRLRIETAGWPVSDYRITNSQLEFRALDPKGRPFPDQRSRWKRLTASELVLHFRLETVVAHWFVTKTAWVAEKLPNVA